MEKELLEDEKTRAEDILLGALGFGETAGILSIEIVPKGYQGTGVWADGEKFEFESDDELSPLEHWALDVLLSSTAYKKAS